MFFLSLYRWFVLRRTVWTTDSCRGMKLRQRPSCLLMMTPTSAMMKSCLGFGEELIFNQETLLLASDRKLNSKPGWGSQMSFIAGSNRDILCAKSLQPCLTLCHPRDRSPPGSSVCGIVQARIVEWVAIPFSRGSSRPRDWTHISYVSCVGRRVLYH